MTQNELTAAANQIALSNPYDTTALSTWLSRIRSAQSSNPNRDEAAMICRRASRAFDYAFDRWTLELRNRLKREEIH